VTTVVDTEKVAPHDRAEAIRETIWASVVRVEIEHHPQADQIDARAESPTSGG
jgi:hypothetical protein